MKVDEVFIGQRVRSLVAFNGVDVGTEGVVVEDYGTGITIAWDRPHNPYPKEMTPEEVGAMWAVNPKCPLRDGFDKKTELHFLEEVRS